MAEINGLTAESTLIEGLPLIIPAGVQRNENNASTYQPYDPNDVIGNISPTAVKPPAKKKCGGLGALLVQVVATVVSIVLDRIIPGAGTYIGGIIRTAAIGATSNAAGQAVAVAAGVQEKFSWSQVGLSGISAGVTQSGVGDAVAKQIGASGSGAIAVSAMTNSAVSQGIGVATGLQDKFSWAGVAAAGASAVTLNWMTRHGPGHERAETDGNGNKVRVPATAGNAILAGGASLIANAATRSLIEGTDFGDNVIAALPDVIGQTIGEAIAGGMTGRGASTTGAPNTGKIPQTTEQVKAVATGGLAKASKTVAPIPDDYPIKEEPEVVVEAPTRRRSNFYNYQAPRSALSRYLETAGPSDGEYTYVPRPSLAQQFRTALIDNPVADWNARQASAQALYGAALANSQQDIAPGFEELFNQGETALLFVGGVSEQIGAVMAPVDS
ncbi:MAG: hypothetical protein J0L81_14740 [Caulobacterales bacterium]|nr:hypothetical protein [Caulobacterales bacterium]